jgi:hypothetical protein
VFLEVHEEPARARSDAQNALRLDLLEPLLERLVKIHAIGREVRLKPDTTDPVWLKPDTTGVASGHSRTDNGA